ncbi:hypothetical protein BS78_04G069000 [Paspalum vaginatum]|nr:hypothetical protein BS78_04G069000 [Paspalum vaginatum]
MAGFDGDDPFGFDFEDDPFDDYGCDGYGGEGLIGAPFADGGGYGDGDGHGHGHGHVEAFCASGFALRGVGGDGGVVLLGEDLASRPSHDEPVLETLGRSFDSDGGLDFLPHLVSALDLVEDASEEEAILRNARGGGGIEEAVDGEDDDDDGIGLMLSGLHGLDPGPVVGGFQAVLDASEGAASDDEAGGGVVGGLMLGGLDLVAPQVARPFRMVVGGEDTDSDDADFNLLEVLAGRVGEAARGLPASRAAVEGLQEVAPTDDEASHGCAVCKDGIAPGQSVLKLPCKHYFHGDCIRPWLAIRNTCPVCRFELPTGDAEYDRRRSRMGVVAAPQQSDPAQSGAARAGSGAMVAAGDATECSGENRPGQGSS